MIVFGSAFASAGFGTSGAVGDEVGGDAGEQLLADVAAEAMARGKLSPSQEQIDSALETESWESNPSGEGRREHQSADQIVGDGVHPQLALDHGRRKSAQKIESEIGLDLAVVQFDLPTLAVQCSDRMVGKSGSVEQGGGDGDGAGAISAARQLEANQTDGDLLGHPLPVPSGDVLFLCPRW